MFQGIEVPVHSYLFGIPERSSQAVRDLRWRAWGTE